MNQKRVTRRDLLDRLYDHDIEEDLEDDDLHFEKTVRRHPEAPLNDSIEFEKRSSRQRRYSRADELDEEELALLELIAARKSRQREHRREEKGSAKDRHWASCSPVLIGCALTCLLTAGLMKGQEIVLSVGALFNPLQAQQQQPSIQPVAVNQPIAINNNRWLTSTPMVTDRSNSMARVPGLTAAKSTITGFADSDSMTAGYYWTLQVSNSGQQNQEARMRIALPPGVTLSRATLWVNGTPQEAAFSTTEQVTSAYNWVRDGREQHRFLSHDPLVITQESPGHLLVKAAPIVPGGQPLQLRLGFTAPLHPSSSQAVTMRLPQIQESNFQVSGTQDVHLQSSTSIWSNESEVTAIPDQSGFVLRGNLQEDRLTSLRINVARTGSDTFATRALHSPAGTFIVASTKTDAQGGQHLSLLKTSKHPNCRIINSEPAAARLSTLWAYGQVEASVRRGDRFTANELARIFRVVSSVSGATVLEQDSDYLTQGLSRDQFATFKNTRGVGSGGAGEGFDSVGSDELVHYSGGRLRRALSAPSFAAAAPKPSPAPEMEQPSVMQAAPKMEMAKPQAKSFEEDKRSVSELPKDSEAIDISDVANDSTSVPAGLSKLSQPQTGVSSVPGALPVALMCALIFALYKMPFAKKLLARFKK